MAASASGSKGINRSKLFWGICIALLPTAFSFVIVSGILGQLKTEFILTNAQVGYIGGAALWGMSVSLLTVGPFLEKIGFKAAATVAFIGHMAGVTLFLGAYPFAGNPSAFWILFLGAICFGAGNGMIEVTGNPMVAALYPDNKTTKLNHFHAFFPGGMILGGLIGFLLGTFGDLGAVNFGHWTFQMSITYIPIVIYGAMMLPEKFPKSETAEAGIPMSEMVSYTFTHPLVWGLILLKMVTLSVEMGPSRWIPELAATAGAPGLLVFVWVSALMMILRTFAEPFVEKFSPTGMLLGASVVTGIGLLMFAVLETTMVTALIAATFFGGGVAFYFPTMVGLMSERFPKAGSLGVILMIGIGFIAAGSSNFIMGDIADSYLPEKLDKEKTIKTLERIADRFPEYVKKAEQAAGNPEQLAELGYRAIEVKRVLNNARDALSYYEENGEFHGSKTGNALRAFIDAGLEQESEWTGRAQEVLGPAENHGQQMAFYWVAPAAFLAALVFLILFINDLRRGGYKAEKLESEE